MSEAKGKKFRKVYARRKLRQALKGTEGFTKVGPSFSRMNYGDGILSGSLKARVNEQE